MNEDKPIITAFVVGGLCGVVLMVMIFTLFSPGLDPDLQKIQRQRDAMRLYEEASK